MPVGDLEALPRSLWPKTATMHTLIKDRMYLIDLSKLEKSWCRCSIGAALNSKNTSSSHCAWYGPSKTQWNLKNQCLPTLGKPQLVFLCK